MEFSSPNTSGSSPDSDISDIWKGGVPGCARCGNIIYDKTVVCLLDKVWHPSCLQCSMCNKQLGNMCYSNGNNILCYDDYIRTNSFKCAGCRLILTDNEYVRRVHGNVYHQACFQCVCCKRGLETGEKFYLRDDDKLVCAEDYHTWKTKDLSENDSDSECSVGSGKRQRTSINQEQLNVLTAAFEKNSKPSRDCRKRLSRDLKLDYRVIQVWFQNRRAKNKKNNNQNLHGRNNQEHNGTSFQQEESSSARFPISSSYHESLYRPPTNRVGVGEWLTTVLAHDSIPPNVDISPVDLINGEILQRPRTQTNRTHSEPSPAMNSQCDWPNIL